jgi:hypothetical protein
MEFVAERNSRSSASPSVLDPVQQNGRPHEKEACKLRENSFAITATDVVAVEEEGDELPCVHACLSIAKD